METVKSPSSAIDDSQRSAEPSALRIVLTYALVAIAWILGTDWALTHWTSGLEAHFHWEIVTNCLFVAVSSLVLYLMLQHRLERLHAARRALQESEHRYRQLVEQSPVAILIQQDGLLQFVNQAALSLFGASSAEELIGRPETDFLHPDEHAAALERSERVLRGEPVGTPQVRRLRRRDGQWFAGEVALARCEFAGRAALQVVIRDITEREQTERALRESRRRYRQLFEQSIDGVVVVDLEGRLLDANSAWRAMFGYTSEGLAGMRVFDLHAPEVLPAARQAFQNILEHGRAHFEIECLRKSGERFPAEIHAVVHELEGQRVIQGVIRDITERKRMENALRRSEEKFMKAFHASPDVLVITRLSDGRILEVNQAFTEKTGYLREEAVGRTTPELQLWADLTDRDRYIDRLARDGRVRDMEARFRTKDGSVRYGAVSAELLDIEGERCILGVIRDITERHQMLEALRRETERTHRLLATTLDGYILADTAGQLLDVNPAYCRLIGYTREQLLRMNIRELEVALTPKQVTERIAAMVTHGSARFETRHRRADGQVVDLDVSIAILQTEDEPVVAAFVRDITDRLAAERALRESERRSRAILQAIPDPLFRLNREGVFLDFKPAEGFPLLRPPEEFLGRRVTDVLPAPIAEQTLQNLQRVLETREPLSYEYQLELGGELREYEARYAVIGADEVLIIVRDITERKRAQHQLEEREAMFRALVEQSLTGIYLIQDGRFAYVNQRLAEIFGYTPEELIRERTVPDLVAEEDRPIVLENIRRRIAGELPSMHYAFRGVRKDGTLIEVEVHGAATLYHGRPAVLGTLLDVTERKRLEMQLRQQQKLEAIGTLAGGVAHEINNPINGIMNYAQLIVDQTPAGQPAAEFAREILHETKRVATIVRNLLQFARQEHQTHSPARISDIVEATLSLIRTIIRRDQIAFEVHVSEDLPVIKCRSQQIQQVLMNLLTNARDALNERYPGYDPDKKMRLEARAIEVEGKPWVRLTVEDHGPGIPPDLRERIFEPFFTTKDRAKGTGLGLAITHSIVQDHRGRLWLESEPGRFTRFHVDLPVDNGWTLTHNGDRSA